MEVKKCPKCGQIKGLNEFSSSGYCKVCYSEYKRQWHENNKDHVKEYNRQWYENNEEYYKRYYEEGKGYYLYIICENNVIQYVGATEVLSKRLNFHINCKSNIKDLMSSDKWTEIKYLDITNVVANREEMLLLENTLIDLYKPMYNKVMNRIRNVDKLREFSLVAEVHDLNKCWKLYCKNKKII